MNSVNPTLASANVAMAQQANGELNQVAQANNNANQNNDRSVGQTSNSGNTTVTLSDQSQANAVQNADYRDLAASQMVNPTASVEDTGINANETTSGSTYASNLASQANYNAQQAQNSVNEQTQNTTQTDAQSITMSESTGQTSSEQDLV